MAFTWAYTPAKNNKILKDLHNEIKDKADSLASELGLTLSWTHNPVSVGQKIVTEAIEELRSNIDYLDDNKCPTYNSSYDAVDNYDSGYDSGHDSPVDSHDSVDNYDSGYDGVNSPVDSYDGVCSHDSGYDSGYDSPVDSYDGVCNYDSGYDSGYDSPVDSYNSYNNGVDTPVDSYNAVDSYDSGYDGVKGSVNAVDGVDIYYSTHT